MLLPIMITIELFSKYCRLNPKGVNYGKKFAIFLILADCKTNNDEGSEEFSFSNSSVLICVKKEKNEF